MRTGPTVDMTRRNRSPRGARLLTLAFRFMLGAVDRETALLVFAQRADARIDIDAWNAHAERFFHTRIGLTEDKVYPPGVALPRSDTAHFVVAPDGAPPGVRAVAGRPREADDLAVAAEIEARAGAAGLALLARRCDTVWLVSRDGNADALALRLAAILASVLLGPILDCSAPELFGVKTARAKLDRMLGR
jgi:hypothetical protein